MDSQKIVSARIFDIYKDLKERGIIEQQRDFAEATGLDEGRVSSFLKGTLKFPKPYYDRFIEAYGVNGDFVKYGEDPVYKNQKENQFFVKQNINLGVESNTKSIGEFHEEDGTGFIDMNDGQYILRVPMVDQYAYAGYAAGWKDEEYIEDLPKVSITVDKKEKGVYRAFEIVGDSMENYTSEEMARISIPDRATLICKELPLILWKNKFNSIRLGVYTIVLKEGIVTKEIIDHDQETGNITCHSYNPKYPDFIINLDDIQALYQKYTWIMPR